MWTIYRFQRIRKYYNIGSSAIKKCLNCSQSHGTLSFRCPKRKEIVQNKIKEIKEKRTTSPNMPEITVEREIKNKLTPEYLAVVTSAITTLAIMRDTYVLPQSIQNKLYRFLGVYISFYDGLVCNIEDKVFLDYENDRVRERLL